MAVFDPLSRYVKPPLQQYGVTDVRGRSVNALPTPEAPAEKSVGRHVRKINQRLDHLAGAYLNDANAFWRLAELNGAVLPDAIAEQELIDIPSPTR